MLKAATATAALLALTGCSSYSGIAAVQRTAEAKDDLPAEIGRVNPQLPSGIRLLTEDAGVKYYAAESSDHTTACIAVYPIDKPDQWFTGCSDGIDSDREIVTISHIGQPTVKLVTTGFDTRALESDGWRKVHDNVLVGVVTRP
ncbi:hypothetical protein [Arthrobacter bambusae]|uniref:hypothetical protein n=1 Tax=Arthrobacter bambusae TaxID=1338426 RepID=UPI0027833161|nr:hypothetical protein [Arthrobacter bambusae]MDQ0028787.1 hypothetical protein [Arthrobacter bambusae]MDQ0096419.1 hypothetical protein [Arthrobacter bambusae]